MIKSVAVGVIGKAVVGMGVDMAKEYGKTQTALGEMASLGYEDMETLRNAAIDFSNTWSGTTRKDFISAAYDIKSGIASLSDEGVAKFTEMSGITAKATKSSIEEMTALFATGYGIYRDNYSSDVGFGEAFSAGISKSVQQFKTKGSEMSSYLSTLGASAQQAGAELSEIFSIGGTLQATMTGSEAATKYNSFLKNAVKAAGELGMQFTDSNNRLLPAVNILEMIKGKYGELLDANEQVELANAFGDDEAVKFITGLYNKTNDLKQAQDAVNTSINGGVDATKAMAQTMNNGMLEKTEIIKQRWANLKDEIGKQMEPGISSALDEVSDKLIDLQSSADFSTMGESIGQIVAVISDLFTSALNNADSFVSGLANGLSWLADNFDTVKASVVFLTEAFVSFKIASAIAPILYAAGIALGVFQVTTTGATVATTGLNAAIAANPIGALTIAITGVIVLIINMTKWFIKSQGGIEEVGKTVEKVMTKASIKWEELKKAVFEMLQDILKYLPLVGDSISENLGKRVDDTKTKIDELQQKLNELEAPDLEVTIDTDELLNQRIDRGKDQQRYYENLYPELANKEQIETISKESIEETSAGSTSSTDNKKERTIKDDISDIEDKYDDKLDLYESRADLAEKQKEKGVVKSNKEAMINVLNQQIKDLIHLESKVSGKDKNIVETAKNKLLSKIADITESIKGGINELVGSFNTPSGLTAMNNYEYLTSTSKIANSKYVSTSNVEIGINVKDLGNLSMKQLNDKMTGMAAMAGNLFGAPYDSDAQAKLMGGKLYRN